MFETQEAYSPSKSTHFYDLSDSDLPNIIVDSDFDGKELSIECSDKMGISLLYYNIHSTESQL